MGLASTRTLTVVSPNVVTYNVLIDGLYKEGKLDNVKRIFYEMSNRNIYLDVVTYNVLIHGLSKEGKLD